MTCFLQPIEMCRIKDCAARWNQLHKAGRHQLTQKLTCRTGCYVERITTAREKVLPSLPPATLAQCATLAFLLHADIAKEVALPP